MSFCLLYFCISNSWTTLVVNVNQHAATIDVSLTNELNPVADKVLQIDVVAKVMNAIK